MTDRIGPAALNAAATGFPAGEAYALQRDYDPAKTALAEDQTLYMYLNMAQFFPHQVVARDGAVRALPVVESEMGERVGALEVASPLGRLSLEQMLADPRSRVQSYLVLHRGRVVYERYPGMRPTDNHVWWSSAKVLAGTLAAQLVVDGLLDPERPVEHYLPAFAASAWKGTSVRDIADHCSGVNAEELDVTSYVSPDSELSRLIASERITLAAGAAAPSHDDALLSMSRKRPPGERYEYSSANTNVLALLIERAVGRRFADVLGERIWSRMGAEGDGLIGLSPQGNPIAHGMFSSRLRDMARFGLLLTPSGRDQRPLLSDQVLHMIQHGGRRALYPGNAKLDNFTTWLGDAPIACSWQWDAVFDDGDLWKGGFHGQSLYVSPGRDVVIALFSTSNERAPFFYTRPVAKLF
ncbi:MAG TPA: serine hydrolase domain-containing protein [Fontimonas sp.]